MVDFVLNLRSLLVWDLNKFRKKYMLGGLGPLNPPVRLGFYLDAFGLNPLSQLVIGHHWLAYLNEVRKNLKSPIHYERCVQNRPYIVTRKKVADFPRSYFI